MVVSRWRRTAVPCLAWSAALACAGAVAAPSSNADAAALADWLGAFYPPIIEVHGVEHALMPILARQSQDKGPLTPADLDVVAAQCKTLTGSFNGLQRALPTPDRDLTVEIQQAVDDIETAADECTRLTEQGESDRAVLRGAVLWPLWDAETYLASADLILTKLNAE